MEAQIRARSEQNDGSRTMLKNSLLAISLLAPLSALSATAHAGSTISDKSYWPAEARQQTQNIVGTARREPSSAFAYDQPAFQSQAAINPNGAPSAWRYQGGPKSR
jgi:hypothetical protein